jgi:hypothetical protein
MRNIFLLPTDKPSSLVLETKNNNLFITTTKDFGTKIMKFQHIYITSDEEIKDRNCWVTNGVEIFKPSDLPEYSLEYANRYWEKIILTTDVDLIKDGVQAIDDDFLEWFIKNPSCEKVEVRKIGEEWIYNADVPKEEFKTLPDVNWQSEIINKVWDEEVEESFATQLFSDNSKIIPDYFQPKSHLENLLEQLDNLESTVDEFVENSSEERLKDAAKIAIPELSHIISDLSKVREIYITGIKSNAARDYWFEKFQEQDNNKFSEEDMMEAVRFGMLYKSDSSKKLFEKKGMVPTEVLKKWFEKFKKK